LTDLKPTKANHFHQPRFISPLPCHTYVASWDGRKGLSWRS